MSVIIDMNMVCHLIDELNRELVYKVGELEDRAVPPGTKFLTLQSDGENHEIFLYGASIYSTKLQESMENIPVETDMLLNERNYFEPYLRALINDHLTMLKNLEA